MGAPLFPQKGENPRGFLKPPGGFKRGPPFWGFLNPQIFPRGKFFPRGKIFGAPFSPQRGNPRGFKTPGVLKGAPFWGF
ncbi:hypothetical protein NV63_18635 [Elizabethkingia anophelis]|nr:hypothetical protein NV63_18635 [Elizabethkingia anophelis]